MKIGLISDTHVPSSGPEPPHKVAEIFRDVDLIIHAGHSYVASCIEWLGRLAPVKTTEFAIGEDGAIVAAAARTPILELEGRTIGIVHELILRGLGDDVLPGSIARAYPRGDSLSAELESIFGQRVDIVAFGYTHESMVETHDGILFVNPGSPSLVGQQERPGTVAILELTQDSCQARIISLA